MEEVATMTFVQDPYKQVGYLQQCLSSDKKPLGLFLGAGCPMAIRVGGGNGQPLIPDIEGITTAVREALSQCADCGPFLKLVDEQFSKDERRDVTVEDMLSHIRALRAVAGKDMVRGLTAENLDRLDEEICRTIHGLADKTLSGICTPYHRVAFWAGGTQRENPVEIFTTNYDLLMEQALEDHRVPYFDGFAGVRKPFFDIQAMEDDRLPPRWARLWKLHGSINWYQVPTEGVCRGATNEEGMRRVIHPSHLKYEESRRMPYLAMIDRLRAFLKQPTAVLVICGHSFRDQHLNEVLIQGLQSTQTAIAFALLYGEMADHPEAGKLARMQPNLSLLARDGGVLGGSEVKWPERDADSVSEDARRWVMWTPIDPANEAGKRTAEFRLGDFAVLGEFLQELTGVARLAAEGANGG
ncbi:MAG: SIR2 family protein [Candidatus Eisenbacteria bacterium]|nr:SIR2 family protein [Candidatus Eisenbacteria bacterium]